MSCNLGDTNIAPDVLAAMPCGGVVAGVPALIPEPPPYLTPVPSFTFTPELAAGEASLGVLGGLGAFGFLGIGTSLAVGAPAPDEYGTGDLEALIAGGFYGDLTPTKAPSPAQDFSVPTVDFGPVQTIQPDLTPNQTITVEASPITVPVPPAIADPILSPVGLPYVSAPFAPHAPGQPAPGRVPLPRARPTPGTAPSPAGAPSPVATPGALPRALPEPSPAPQPAPLPNPEPAPRYAQPTTPPFLRPGIPTGNPLLDVPLAPSVTYPQAGVGVGPFMEPELGSVPTPNPELAPARKDCPPKQKKDDKKQQQRKGRSVCHAGTYRERTKGLTKHATRTIQCR